MMKTVAFKKQKRKIGRKIQIVLAIIFFFNMILSCTSADFQTEMEKKQTVILQEYFLESVKGKTLYFVKVNPSPAAIKAENVSYITDFSGMKAQAAAIPIPAADGRNFGSSTARVPMIIANSVKPVKQKAIQNSQNTENLEKKLEIGKSKKQIFIDCDSSLSAYKIAQATLRAVGAECLVWVVDGNFQGDGCEKIAENAKISQETVDFLSQKFDEICPKIRAIFGRESDEIYARYSEKSRWEKSPIITDSRVNIVVYDIGSDFPSDGVLGYFHSRDYFASEKHLAEQGFFYKSPSLSASNEGKFIYLDAFSAQSKPVAAASTLAHEFAHMVSYGEKTMKRGIKTSAEYEEMMAMLAEDALQSALGVPNSESPEARLPFFAARYAEIGLEYRESTDGYFDILSYASNFSFGAWLARNFGGAALISKMAKSALSGFDCALSAVNELNGENYSARDLLLLYAKSCTIKSASFSHNRALSGDYPFRAIDLWNLGADLEENSEYVRQGYYSYTGCTLFAPSARLELRPYGMSLSKVGKIESDDAFVTIITGGKSDEVWQLLVE